MSRECGFDNKMELSEKNLIMILFSFNFCVKNIYLGNASKVTQSFFYKIMVP